MGLSLNWVVPSWSQKNRTRMGCHSNGLARVGIERTGFNTNIKLDQDFIVNYSNFRNVKCPPDKRNYNIR